MSADQYKAKGNDAFKVKNYTEAIAMYSKAIEIEPKGVAAGALYSNRAASYSALGQHEKALADSDLCISCRPDWLKGHYRKGVALEALGRIDEAVKAFQDAQKQESSPEVNDKIQFLNEAIRKRNESSKPQRVTDPEEARKLGNSLFGNSKYDEASAYYTRAIELYGSTVCPEKASCFCNRAACHQQTHNFSAVIADCTSALEIDPNHAKALLRRAIAYEGNEKWKLALADYQAVNRLTPGLSNVSQAVVRCQRAVNY